MSKKLQGTSLVQEWRNEVKKVGFNDDWFCNGTVLAPVMKVNQRTAYLPFADHVLTDMYQVAVKAPFGKGTETVIDESVRKGLQIDPSFVNFCNETSWNRKLKEIANELRETYKKKNISLHFYKMLLYEEGGFFSSHKDTLRDTSHFASLLISLPVVDGCEGGVLRVTGPGRHSKYTLEWDGHAEEDFECSWCSFYTDCQHELLPVTKGRRVVLSYQVHSNDASMKLRNIDAADLVHRETTRLFAIIDSALAQRENALILLNHLYPYATEARNLKGFDRCLYEMLERRYKNSYQLTVAGIDFQLEDWKLHHYNRRKKVINFDLQPMWQNPIPNADQSTFGTFEIGCKNRGLTSKDPLRIDGETPCGESASTCEDLGYEFEEMLEEIDHRYFYTPSFAMLFSADDFGKRPCQDHSDYIEHMGNEAAPERLQYHESVLALTKIRTTA